MFSRVSIEKSPGWQEMFLGTVRSVIVGKLCTLALECLGKYLTSPFKFSIITLQHRGRKKKKKLREIFINPENIFQFGTLICLPWLVLL